MPDKYRIVKVNTTDGASDNRQRYNWDTEAPENHRNVQPASIRRRTGMWVWGLGLGLVVLVVLAVVWMNGVQASLAHLNQTATHNANALAAEQSKLSGIQAHLNAIDAQLGRMQAQIQSFFTNFMQFIRHL